MRRALNCDQSHILDLIQERLDSISSCELVDAIDHQSRYRDVLRSPNHRPLCKESGGLERIPILAVTPKSVSLLARDLEMNDRLTWP